MYTAADHRSAPNTLGFFVRGIPAVFLRSDLFALEPPELKEYLSFYQVCQVGAVPARETEDARVLHGFELSAAASHEIRHFHDALLCPSLFELFVLRAKEAFSILQLAGRLRLNPSDLPTDVKTLDASTDSEGRKLLAHLGAMRASYKAKYASTFRNASLNGHSIRVSHLMEASAVGLELVTLFHVHGLKTGTAYYNQVVRPLGSVDPIYTELLNYFLSIAKDLLEATSLMLIVVPTAMYGEAPPARALVELIDEGRGEPRRLLEVALERRERLFQNDAELARRFSQMHVASTTGERIDAPTEQLARSVIELPRAMLALREQLRTKCVTAWKYRLDAYLEKLNELPFPATVFFPDKRDIESGKVATVPFSHLPRDTHVIAATAPEERGWHDVAAAVVPTAGVPPCVPLPLVDWLMFMTYVRSVLFERKSSVFGAVIDDVYRKLAEKYFAGN